MRCCSSCPDHSPNLEPREGGHCYELGPHGFRCDWGRVVTCQPPARIAFTWQISAQRVPQPDPSQASLVEVRFEPDGDGATRVTLAHRHFSRHGEGAEGYEAAMSSPQGWPLLLERFAGRAMERLGYELAASDGKRASSIS